MITAFALALILAAVSSIFLAAAWAFLSAFKAAVFNFFSLAFTAFACYVALTSIFFCVLAAKKYGKKFDTDAKKKLSKAKNYLKDINQTTRKNQVTVDAKAKAMK